MTGRSSSSILTFLRLARQRRGQCCGDAGDETSLEERVVNIYLERDGYLDISINPNKRPGSKYEVI